LLKRAYGALQVIIHSHILVLMAVSNHKISSDLGHYFFASRQSGSQNVTRVCVMIVFDFALVRKSFSLVQGVRKTITCTFQLHEETGTILITQDMRHGISCDQSQNARKQKQLKTSQKPNPTSQMPVCSGLVVGRRKIPGKTGKKVRKASEKCAIFGKKLQAVSRAC
jgi:hypothetical protein